MFQDAFHSTERLDHIGAVIVQIPQLSVVLLMRPPERVLLQDLILLEILSDAPALVIGQR